MGYLPAQLTDITDQISLYDEYNPHDTFAVLPVVGVPFAYNQFRQGRGNLPSTLASLMLGIGMSESVMYFSMRSQGYKSSEILLARLGSAAGIRFAGRGYWGHMFNLPLTAAGGSWAPPLWLWPLAVYEIWQAGDWWMETGRFRAYDSFAYEYSQ